MTGCRVRCRLCGWHDLTRDPVALWRGHWLTTHAIQSLMEVTR